MSTATTGKYALGIAEEHAVTFAAGLAAQGLRPVVAIYATFIQRTIDHVINDVALQNPPALFALDRAGFVNDDGETHQGLFDLFRPIPRMIILGPAGAEELKQMLTRAFAAPVRLGWTKISLFFIFVRGP